MKRYIRSSFDPTIPAWLKDKFTSSKFGSLAEKFVNKYGVALSDAKFTTAPTGRSLAIYKFLTKWGGTKVYIPGINDDEQLDINGRSRKLGSIAKSKLPSLAEEIVYIDLDANRVSKEDRYKDPRFIYDRGAPEGRYGGQKYNDYKGAWLTQTASNERNSRDKSGYAVPSPESKLQRYYTMFPEKITQKIDALYNRILEVKDKVLDPAYINTPRESDETSDVGNAIYRLRDAIDSYRDLLAMLKSAESKGGLSSQDTYVLQNISKTIKRVSGWLDEAEYKLTHKW